MSVIHSWIVSISALITAGFTIMLYIVNRTNALAVKKNTEIVDELKKRQQAEDASLSSLYREKLIEDAKYVQRTVYGQSYKENFVALKNCPRTPGLSNLELARYFTVSEREIIKKIWGKYVEYYSKYWFDIETGGFSETANGFDKSDMQFDSINVGQDIERLINQM